MSSQSHKSWNLVAGIVLPIITLLFSAPLLGHALHLFIMRNHHKYDNNSDYLNYHTMPRVQTLISLSLLAVFLFSNAAPFLRPRRLGFPKLFLSIGFIICVAYAGVNDLRYNRLFSSRPKCFKAEYPSGQRKWEQYQVVKIEQSQWRFQRVQLRFVSSYYLQPFDRRVLPYIQPGCCMRPGKCELERVNATLGITRNREGPPLDTAMIYGRHGGEATIRDYYDMWRNELSVLYYDCMTCQVKIIKSPRLRKWWQLDVFFSSITCLLD
ncbi:unnamed protein product [Eruca vesicaria subsp. sativa]|uniref:Uncharacterized protein n=1 Tax=Eruca vesicaria subsp. sativa TaxID=29727 RepID=A0ABC8KEZ8_ERUVS|nr:unnamed protein product [Eruca vesicaria subsp. sativa]